ncbi:hypothetical protein [Dactylosporangium sp. CA-139066]|uniref:hypothetical protein n=1 Tax=Dactylosporangium sp. CA-139066 TaxID=3239930 RepID=UPI003D8A10DA
MLTLARLAFAFTGATFALIKGPRKRTADADAAVGNLGYQPRHAAPRAGKGDDWWPAHTNTAVAAPDPGRHARPPGIRPDLRIEKTEEISVGEIRALHAWGVA